MAIAEPLSLPRAVAAWFAVGGHRVAGMQAGRQTDVPPGSGLGSSNAMTVALVVAGARALGMTTVALTGRHGGRLARLASQAVRISPDQIEIVEDAHLVIAHSLYVAIRQTLAVTPARNGLARPEVVPVQLAGD